MWVRVFIFFGLEGSVFSFEFHNERNIDALSCLWIVILFIFCLHITMRKLTHHICKTTLFVNQCKRAYSVGFTNPEVISAKTWGNMNNTGSIFSRNKISGNYAKCIPIFRLCIRHQLFITNSFQVSSFAFANYFERYGFLAGLIDR